MDQLPRLSSLCRAVNTETLFALMELIYSNASLDNLKTVLLIRFGTWRVQGLLFLKPLVFIIGP